MVCWCDASAPPSRTAAGTCPMMGKRASPAARTIAPYVSGASFAYTLTKSHPARFWAATSARPSSGVARPELPGHTGGMPSMIEPAA